MNRLILWVKTKAAVVAFLLSVALISGCNEEHPDNLPGAVNNPHPILSVSSEATVAIDPADSSMIYSVPIQLSVVAPESGSFNFRVVPGTALEGRDYSVAASQVSFNKGDRQANIEITLINDATRTQPRDFRLELTSASNAKLSENINHTVTIAARTDDSQPDIDLPELSVTENITINFDPLDASMDYSVPITLSKAAEQAGSVQVRVISETAIAGRDYEANVTEVFFAEGEHQTSLPLKLINRENRTQDRSFKVVLTGATNAVLSGSYHQTITLAARDASSGPSMLNVPAGIAFLAPSVADASFPIVIPLSKPLTDGASVDVLSVTGTAQAGTHYEHVDTTYNLSEGDTELVLFVTIKAHAIEESRSFKLAFLSASGLELSTQREMEVTLNYSEEPVQSQLQAPGTISLRMPSQFRGQASYPIVLPLSEPLQGPATLAWRTVEDTAIAGVHFEAKDSTGANSSQLSAGANEFSFDLTLMHDAAVQENLNFNVQLVSAERLVLPSERNIQIEVVHSNEDNSEFPTVSFASEYRVHEPQPTAVSETLYLTLSEALTEDAQLSVRAIDGTATAGNHFNLEKEWLQIPAGSTRIALPIELVPNGATDDIAFSIELYNPVKIELPTQRTFSVEIIENSHAVPEPSLALTPNIIRVPMIKGSTPQQVKLYFPISAARNVSAGSTVHVESRNGTAIGGEEFDAISGNFTLPVNEDELALSVNLLPQNVAEVAEFELRFSEVNNVALPPNRTVTVQIESYNTPELPTLSPPEENWVMRAPEGPNAVSRRKLVVPFSDIAPLAGRVNVYIEDVTAKEGTHFTIVDTRADFSIGEQQVVFEFDIEPANTVRSFRVMLESADNVLLPSGFEDRVITVVIEPY